ncbi:hypothetical protein CAI21_18145 [Alkalilimnicola ehrlichii]|uniref:Uncharacterized protein n=1 Tax=Alkalilimnicola ehrlichii TaxID=351052 RepID=A0A3E0WLP6_9GAMM|nr:hypothetical protein [Alkalilimnicola ehrlichii]RFA25872.1 hypothetical protein CAI21_18145 [Alkalilimnicola ehrlichii]RFA33071.1 hypothetical protein CAL65_18035 [Alkalilimnicola ehrlichii]
MIYRLMNTGDGWNFRDVQLIPSSSGILQYGPGRNERREAAILYLLQTLVTSKREYQEILEHIGPVTPGGSATEKANRAEANQQQIMDFLDGRQKREFLSWLEDFT